MDKTKELERLADDMIASMKDYMEVLETNLPAAVEALSEYVYKRVMPEPVLTETDAETELGHAVMILGSALELKPKEGEFRYNDDFLPPWAYKDENPLRTLLNQAEHFNALDFDEPNYKFLDSGSPALVMTLEDLAKVSGRSIGSIRNATGSELKVVRHTNIADWQSNPVNQKVFVEFTEAKRWLASKNAYEPLRREAAEKKDHVQKVKEYGPNFDGKALPDFLRLRSKGDLEVYYAPFEYVNKKAKVVLCGITPGAAQAEVALNTLARCLIEGMPKESALKAAKETASFAGPMRKSLAKMLDHIGLQRVLGLTSCSELFDGAEELVHYTSAQRNPVFFRGGNYTGNPLMLKEEALKWQVNECLAKEVEQLGFDTVYIPLGPRPAEALMYLVEKGLLSEKQVLAGIPHPSGANAERIKYFCEEKAKDALSSRTNADAIDASRETIKSKLKSMNL